MDGSRFDSLARTLAEPGSRRRFVAGLAAGALGLLGSRAALADQAPDHCALAGEKAKPDKEKGCCLGLLAGPDGRCEPDRCFGVACTPQDPCHSAACDPVAGTCVQTALTGTVCPQGVCQAGACVCAPIGGFCTGFAMCCSENCVINEGGIINQCRP